MKLLLSLLFTWFLIELGAAAIIFAGVLPARLPPFQIPQAQRPFVVDVDPHFGAWHRPNDVKVHKRACFDVTYHSNSYGAIDVERSKMAKKPRTVVLGDSFTMGHGVDASMRFSNRLEERSNIPHLNFGVGGTGPLQYLMRYEHLARDFEHTRVLVAILPDNDFSDDAPTKERYRPHWEGSAPHYTLRYNFDSLEESPLHPSHHRAELSTHDVLGSFSFFYNAADWVVGARKVLHRRKSAPNYAGYFDFTEAEFCGLRHTMSRFVEVTPKGGLTVMGIPRLIDLTRYEAEGKNPFGDAMTRAARELGFQFVDMLPLMAQEFAGRERELFLGCDGHWSPQGHDMAARILEKRMYVSE